MNLSTKLVYQLSLNFHPNLWACFSNGVLYVLQSKPNSSLGNKWLNRWICIWFRFNSTWSAPSPRWSSSLIGRHRALHWIGRSWSWLTAGEILYLSPHFLKTKKIYLVWTLCGLAALELVWEAKLPNYLLIKIKKGAHPREEIPIFCEGKIRYCQFRGNDILDSSLPMMIWI